MRVVVLQTLWIVTQWIVTPWIVKIVPPPQLLVHPSLSRDSYVSSFRAHELAFTSRMGSGVTGRGQLRRQRRGPYHGEGARADACAGGGWCDWEKRTVSVMVGAEWGGEGIGGEGTASAGSARCAFAFIWKARNQERKRASSLRRGDEDATGGEKDGGGDGRGGGGCGMGSGLNWEALCTEVDVVNVERDKGAGTGGGGGSRSRPA